MVVRINTGTRLNTLFDLYLEDLFSSNIKRSINFFPERDAYLVNFTFEVEGESWHHESWIPSKKLVEFSESNEVKSKIIEPIVLGFVEAYMGAQIGG